MQAINALELAKQAAAILDEKKGDAIVILDVREISTVTDYYVLVTGNSPPHLKALSNELAYQLKAAGEKKFRRAGAPEGGWLVLDYMDVIIHILSEEARAYYDLEGLWAAAPKVPRRRRTQPRP